MLYSVQYVKILVTYYI